MTDEHDMMGDAAALGARLSEALRFLPHTDEAQAAANAVCHAYGRLQAGVALTLGRSLQEAWTLAAAARQATVRP